MVSFVLVPRITDILVIFMEKRAERSGYLILGSEMEVIVLFSYPVVVT